jgi:hypothetical protein
MLGTLLSVKYCMGHNIGLSYPSGYYGGGVVATPLQFLADNFFCVWNFVLSYLVAVGCSIPHILI